MPNMKECDLIGLDPNAVRRFEKRITRLLKEMDEYNLFLFCGSGNSIRAYEYGTTNRPLIVGSYNGANTEGGCGAEKKDENGFWRGE